MKPGRAEPLSRGKERIFKVLEVNARSEVGESMASKYLDGSMVPRAVTRNWDQRDEPRSEVRSQTAIIELRGRNYEVELANISRSGAMLIFSLIPQIGETISIRLPGRPAMSGSICWVRDGKIGINFTKAVE